MQFDGFTNECQSLIPCLSSGDTAWKVGHIRTKRRRALLENDKVAHWNSYFFKPACLSTLFKVPTGTSVPACPAMVTVPGFVGW
jgi:hypothetical protein